MCACGCVCVYTYFCDRCQSYSKPVKFRNLFGFLNSNIGVLVYWYVLWIYGINNYAHFCHFLKLSFAVFIFYFILIKVTSYRLL